MSWLLWCSWILVKLLKHKSHALHNLEFKHLKTPVTLQVNILELTPILQGPRIVMQKEDYL
jgi:hypothetical protein